MRTFLTILGSVAATVAVVAVLNRVPPARKILGS